MCSECRQTPCDFRCPNADEPKPRFFCDECGGGIYVWDSALRYGEVTLCTDCVRRNTEEVLPYDEC